jgi:hypothetical protein
MTLRAHSTATRSASGPLAQGRSGQDSRFGFRLPLHAMRIAQGVNGPPGARKYAAGSIS